MNNISKKFIASLLLTTFAFTNSLLTVSSMENATVNQYSKPILRDSDNFSMKLKGDESFIKSKTPVSISLRDSDVKQVLRMFADKAGMNIIFHDSVTGNVTLDLVDVPLSDAFDMILSISNLNYTVENNTIIVAKAGASGFNMAKQDMTLIPVKYISASAVASFLNKNIYNMNKPGLSNTDIVTTNPATNELIIFGSKNDVAIAKKIVDKFDKKPVTTTFKLNHTTPAEMATSICNMLLPATGTNSKDNGGFEGGGGGSGDSSSTDSPKIDLNSALGKMTGGAAGVMTGAAADEGGGKGGESGGDSNGGGASGGGGAGGTLTLNGSTVACTINGQMTGSFGLQNIAVAYYNQLGTVDIIGGSESQIEMIREYISHVDKKQSQAYLEVSIIELNEDGSKAFQNNWKILSNSFSAEFTGDTTKTTDYNPIFLKGSGYTFGKYENGEFKPESIIAPFGGSMQITLAINYLIKNKKGRVVANPKVLITNGEKSTIDITDDYIKSVTINQTVANGGVLTTRNYNIGNDNGIKIEVTPFISPDGYVTLNLKPEYSVIQNRETITDPTVGEYVAATLLSRRNVDLKNVRIKDGETLVIGGLINEVETKNVGKIPVLGDLPGIGALFRSTRTDKTKSEMVIMITPKILTDTEDAVGNTDAL